MARETKMTLHNDEEQIGNLFRANGYYEIPFFQRDYKWRTKKIHGLQENFDQILDEEKSVHFLGAMIFYSGAPSFSEAQKYEIIDGQQRITTIFLFLAAATKWFVIEKFYLEAEGIFTRNLINPLEKSENSKLHPSKDDRAQLNAIFDDILTKPFQEHLGKTTYGRLAEPLNSSRKGNLKENFNAFLNYIKSKAPVHLAPQERKERITRLLDDVLQRCTVVSLHVIDRQNGPIIFDSLNANQEAMTIAELVKNGIFARVSDQNPDELSHLHDTLWVPFAHGFDKKSKSIDNFFFPYGLIANPNIKKNETYNELFKSWGSKSPKEIISEMSLYQTPFVALMEGKTEDYDKALNSTRLTTMYESGMPSTALPFFMRLLTEFSTGKILAKNVNEVFLALETFFVRRAVCNYEPSGLHAVFKRLWNEIEHPTPTAVMEYINSQPTVAVPSNDEFKAHIETNQMYKKGITPFLLREFDRSLSGEIPEGKTSIEHVLPQSLDLWKRKFSPDEHEAWKDTLANLVPLTISLNKTVSNKPFQDKKREISKNAMYKSTRELFETNDDWTVETLKARSLVLSNWALSRWPLS